MKNLGGVGTKKEGRIKVNVETAMISKKAIMKWFVNDGDGRVC